MKRFITILLSVFLVTSVFAQQANKEIAKGNEAYRKADYATAIESYKNALRKEPENNTARFNLANALQKKSETEASEKNYDDIIKTADVNSLNYNKALAFIKEKNLKNAIDAFRESLKENPSDDDARENLQKAMNEYKQQQQQNQPKPKDQPKQQKQKQQKQPPVNKQMMQQKFDELRNQEKQLQKKLQSKNSSGDQTEDW